jgi:hypothetical protein
MITRHQQPTQHAGAVALRGINAAALMRPSQPFFG